MEADAGLWWTQSQRPFVYNSQMPYRLALVTGAAQRLGRAFAVRLAARGYDVIVAHHRSVLEAEATAQEIEKSGVRAFPMAADLGSPEETAGLLAAVHRLDGTLAIVVNSASVLLRADPQQLTVDEWDASLDANLRAPYFISQQAATHMSGGGLIVNITDVGAGKAWPRFPAYAISKAGLEAMTRILARAWAPTIRVNAIAPGLVLPSESISSEEWERLVNRLPLRRTARLEEVTLALDFLIDNQYVTGQTIVVDGGYSLI